MTGLLILLLIWVGLPLLFVVVLVGSRVLDGGKPPQHRTVAQHFGVSWTCACGMQVWLKQGDTHEEVLRAEAALEDFKKEHMELNEREAVG